MCNQLLPQKVGLNFSWKNYTYLQVYKFREPKHVLRRTAPLIHILIKVLKRSIFRFSSNYSSCNKIFEFSNPNTLEPDLKHGPKSGQNQELLNTCLYLIIQQDFRPS
jgi:hypothetical protein